MINFIGHGRMFLRKLLFPFCYFVLNCTAVNCTEWKVIATSRNYDNTRLVLERPNPMTPQYISKDYPKSAAERVCINNCLLNPTCRTLSLYPMDTHYVCELFTDNFCFQRQRMALREWPGGVVWDKLLPGMKKACIDQKFQNASKANFCEIGRPGCRSSSNVSSGAWPGCNSCAQTCIDCARLNNQSGPVNCTLWPEGSFQSPIFAMCMGNDTIWINRQVNLATGIIQPNYRMSFKDMYRLFQLKIYKQLRFAFGTVPRTYSGSYKGFVLEENGTLSNITYAGGGQDGLHLGNRPLPASPWIEVESDCGSFWFLNFTQNTSSLECPGGNVGMLGAVNIKTTPKQTGIRWPKATMDNATIFSTNLRVMQ